MSSSHSWAAAFIERIGISICLIGMPFARAVKYVDSKSAAFTASWALGPIFFQISLLPS